MFKKVVFSILIIFISNYKIFASSGVEAVFTIPFGISIYDPGDFSKLVGYEGGVNFDTALTAQVGYLFETIDNFGIGMLLETGYAYNSISLHLANNKDDYKLEQQYHDIMIGVVPKINIYDFGLSVGVGFKIPVYSSIRIKKKNNGQTEEENLNFNAAGFKYTYNSAAITYVRVALDYSIFFTENWAMNVGGYFEYNIIPPIKGSLEQPYSLNTGIQIGAKFASKR